jgi:hypothetical protein
MLMCWFIFRFKKLKRNLIKVITQKLNYSISLTYIFQQQKMSRRGKRISPESSYDYNQGDTNNYIVVASPRRTVTRMTRMDEYDDSGMTSRSSGGSYTIKHVKSKSTTFLPSSTINVNGESYGDYPNYQQVFPSPQPDYSFGGMRGGNNSYAPRRIYRIEVEDQYPDQFGTYMVSPRSMNGQSPPQRRHYVPPTPKNQIYERLLKKKVIRKPNHRVEIDEPVMRDKPSMNRPVVHGGAVVYK